MQNSELLAVLQQKLATGELTTEAVLAVVTPAIPPRTLHDRHTSALAWFSVTNILYTLGALILIAGLLIFVSQIWDDIGSGMRIVITLGLGSIFLLYGWLLTIKRPHQHIGTVFYGLGGLILPFGFLVVLSEFNHTSIWDAVGALLVNTAVFALLLMVHRRPILALFTIASCTVLGYLTLAGIVENRNVDEEIFLYFTIILGFNYLVLAHWFQMGEYRSLVGLLRGFGTLGILWAGFLLVLEYPWWELTYFLLLGGGTWWAIKERSRIILAFSLLFLIIHVAYLTAEYFADSLGWPISLMLLGSLFIGIGYFAIHINRTFKR